MEDLLHYTHIIEKFLNKLVNNGASLTDLVNFEKIILPQITIDLDNEHKIHVAKRMNAQILHMFQSINRYYMMHGKLYFDEIKKEYAKKYFYKSYGAMYYFGIKNMDINDIKSSIRCIEIYNQFINFLYKEFFKTKGDD